jgi:hypothetical protein
LNKSSQGSWLQTDTTESACEKTDYRILHLTVPIITVEQMPESSIKEAHPQKFQVLTPSPFTFDNKEAYGNLARQASVDLLTVLASSLLAHDGSIMVELRNFC